MCTYATEQIEATGAAKGPNGWFRIDEATVYFDHPVHALPEHTLNINFAAPGAGPSARVAVELSASTAERLIDAIRAALASAPAAMRTD